LIVTVGGGSITDGAKAVQMCLANDIRTADAMDSLRPVKAADGTVGPPGTMKGPTGRQISVQTTICSCRFILLSDFSDERSSASCIMCGEVRCMWGGSDGGRKVKELLGHPRIIPTTVILDPAITRHTPEWLWLSTGVRAVDHCVEGICSREAHAYGDAQALKGL